MLCCAIKPMCAWNAEEVASVARERCGGQGYLSCNRCAHWRDALHPAQGEGLAVDALTIAVAPCAAGLAA